MMDLSKGYGQTSLNLNSFHSLPALSSLRAFFIYPHSELTGAGVDTPIGNGSNGAGEYGGMCRGYSGIG